MGTLTPLPSRTPEQSLGLPVRVSEPDALQGLPGLGDPLPPLAGWKIDPALDTAVGWHPPISLPHQPLLLVPALPGRGHIVAPWEMAWEVVVVVELC